MVTQKLPLASPFLPATFRPREGGSLVSSLGTSVSRSFSVLLSRERKVTSGALFSSSPLSSSFFPTQLAMMPVGRSVAGSPSSFADDDDDAGAPNGGGRRTRWRWWSLVAAPGAHRRRRRRPRTAAAASAAAAAAGSGGGGGGRGEPGTNRR